ncbi:hypothetical protein N7U62_22670, partial [Reichenbachiella sp. ABR2-5]|nr:hypothetical protein [Reichenbachiella ulvae]
MEVIHVPSSQNENSLKDDSEKASSQNENLKTNEKIAKQFDTSVSTIMRDADFAKGLENIGLSNPELKRDILIGKVKANKGLITDFAKVENPEKMKVTSVS